jgi:hypothetical protein
LLVFVDHEDTNVLFLVRECAVLEMKRFVQQVVDELLQRVIVELLRLRNAAYIAASA